MTSSRRLVVAAILGVGAVSSGLRAQATPTGSRAPGGDGRVHAPAKIEVGYAPLRPDEVTTVILHPLHGSLLRFPYQVKDAVVADAGTFGVQKYENTAILWTKTCPQGCATTLYVFLDDGDLTPVPFLVVVDTTKPPTIKRDYTDPLNQRIAGREAEMLASLQRAASHAVVEQLAAEVERCIAAGFTFRPVNLHDAWQNAATGEAIGVHALELGHSGRCLERPQMYLRYRIENAQYAPLETIRLRLVRKRRDGTLRAITTIADRRTPEVVPALRSVRGDLIVDGTLTLEAGEGLWLHALVGGHVLLIGPVLTAPGGNK